MTLKNYKALKVREYRRNVRDDLCNEWINTHGEIDRRVLFDRADFREELNRILEADPDYQYLCGDEILEDAAFVQKFRDEQKQRREKKKELREKEKEKTEAFFKTLSEIDIDLFIRDSLPDVVKISRKKVVNLFSRKYFGWNTTDFEALLGYIDHLTLNHLNKAFHLKRPDAFSVYLRQVLVEKYPILNTKDDKEAAAVREWLVKTAYYQKFIAAALDGLSEITQEVMVDLIAENPKYDKIGPVLKRRYQIDRLLSKNIIREIPERYCELFPEARARKRSFIIHCGPTNSGKTYAALEAYKNAPHGIYLGPLRLLAFEVYEKTKADGIPCNMITGEEEIIEAYAYHQASTVEMLNPVEHYEVAVIDECQMVADRERGGAFTNAIMGVNADEIHLAVAPHALEMVKKIIEYCNDSYEVIFHERNTPLLVDSNKFRFPMSVQRKDALIVFSKRNVLAVASELQRKGIFCSVIYGSLPYEVRQMEVKKFNEGITDVVVSTDAIGMGLNLPVRRIVFLEAEKFDGEKKRMLNEDEVQQIAGRAGRRGWFDTGYVNAEFFKKTLMKMLETKMDQLQTAYLAFPRRLIDLEGNLSDIMKKWYAIEETSFFLKKDMERDIKLCLELEKRSENKELIYRFICIPFAEDNASLHELWLLLFDMERRQEVDLLPLIPEIPPASAENLQSLENCYQICNLLYYFSRVFKYKEPQEAINETRKNICETIMQIMAEQKLIGKKCKRCGRKLSWNTPNHLCERCYEKRYFSRY